MEPELHAGRAPPPQLVALALLIVAVPALFWTTTASMVRIWISNETFTHGFLILPICLWLLWQCRHALAAVRPGVDLRALLALAPCLALWFVATLVEVAVVRQLTMVATIPLLAWLLLGLPLVRKVLFPLLYLFFAVPLGQSLIPPMMELTADATVSLVQLSGVPIYRDGLSFELPTGRWAVAEECSGVRYLIASAALGTIYAYLTYRSPLRRVLFVAASLVVPVIANILRAYGIVMLGHLSGMTLAVGADHLLYGWVFFGIVIFLLFWLGGFWAESSEPVRSGAPPDAGPAARRPPWLPGALALAGLLALNLAAAGITARSAVVPAPITAALPEALGGLAQLRSGTPARAWSPLLENPDQVFEARYGQAADERDVTVRVAYFYQQRPGAEAISSTNRLVDPYEGAWKLLATRTVAVEGTSFSETELLRGEEKLLVWSGYFLDGKLLASPVVAKLVQAKAMLFGDDSASFLTLSTPLAESPGVSRDRLGSAWRALRPWLEDTLAAGASAVSTE